MSGASDTPSDTHPPNGEGAGGGPGTSQNVFAKHIMVLFLMIFGRTELIISVSEANFDEEADFEVHWPPNPLNPDEKLKKLFFRTENFRQFFFSASKNETSGIV